MKIIRILVASFLLLILSLFLAACSGDISNSRSNPPQTLLLTKSDSSYNPQNSQNENNLSVNSQPSQNGTEQSINGSTSQKQDRSSSESCNSSDSISSSSQLETSKDQAPHRAYDVSNPDIMTACIIHIDPLHLLIYNYNENEKERLAYVNIANIEIINENGDKISLRDIKLKQIVSFKIKIETIIQTLGLRTYHCISSLKVMTIQTSNYITKALKRANGFLKSGNLSIQL